jgi:CHASE2 domain-containing sensor protein
VAEDPGKHRRSFRDDWDPRAIIALIVIIGAFGLAAVALVMGKSGATIPAWVAALVGGISIYYYKANGKGE